MILLFKLVMIYNLILWFLDIVDGMFWYCISSKRWPKRVLCKYVFISNAQWSFRFEISINVTEFVVRSTLFAEAAVEISYKIARHGDRTSEGYPINNTNIWKWFPESRPSCSIHCFPYEENILHVYILDQQQKTTIAHQDVCPANRLHYFSCIYTIHNINGIYILIMLRSPFIAVA